MHKFKKYRSDLLAVLTLFILPLLWFLPVLFPAFSGQTLLPYDNLYTFEPWRSLQPGLIPHNDLLSDLVLENAVWKQHIRQTLSQGQLPLWNPQIFTGLPFLAAGQASTFYPLNILFYLLPLDAAYGWFTALQIALAGINMYLFGRVLRLRPLAALLSGIIYMFSGFLIVSVVFTMFVAAVAWLPLLLAVIEFIIRKQEEKGTQSFSPIPYIISGVTIIGLTILAGHPEMIYYTLLVAGAYTLFRLIVAWQRIRQFTLPPEPVEGDARLVEGDARLRQAQPASRSAPLPGRSANTTPIFKLACWLLFMALLGIAVGGIQLLPLLELLPLNFREGSASYAQVVEWAWPDRHILTFFLPDVFGNPSHHRWFDLWSQSWVPATVNALGEPNTTIFWGIKNYVEGGNYLGIGSWLLVVGCWLLVAGRWLLAIGRWRRQTLPRSPFKIHHSPLTIFFSLLALISLAFAFGTPLYALLFYGLPGWNQLHSPFRWVFPFTLSMAVLAGIGLQLLLDRVGQRDIGRGREQTSADVENQRSSAFIRFQNSLLNLLPIAAILAALALLATVVASLFLPEPFIQLGQRIVDGSDLAQFTFSDGRMFWGYQALNLVKFGSWLLVAGLLVGGLVWTRSVKVARILALALITCVMLDLYSVHGNFNPSSDVALNPTLPQNQPPAVAFLNQHDLSNEEQPWRFTTFNRPGEKTFNANVGMYYGWHDIRGYDSVIPRQYVQLMNQIAPQENELLYNRVAPLYSNVKAYDILDNPLLDLLNVKYVLTQHFIPNPNWQEIYRDPSMGIYENKEVMARVQIIPQAQVLPVEEQPLLASDLREVLFIEEEPEQAAALTLASPQIAEAQISRYTANDVFVDVNLTDRGWLLLADAYFPGWKAYVRPFGSEENQEEELTIYRANGAFRAVYLPEQGQWTVRFVYTPMSFKLGLFISFLAAMIAFLLLLFWGWGRYYRPESTEGEVRTVAKNSLVPIALNITNKAVNFAFAMLYIRLLGPEGTGKYYFVVALYGIFEILSSYGLGTLLTRDVAADKNQSSRYLTNVLALRTILWAIAMPVLALVTVGYRNMDQLAFWDVQNIGNQEVQAIALLGLSMLFANWADALSNCFNAFEKMEYPAGLTNGTALLKVTLGAAVLLMGWGFVGLAGVSLAVNILQVGWLYRMLQTTLFKPEWQWDGALQIWMLRNSGPLMINHLLATIFWRIDVWILRPIAGAASVGLYSVGLKYLDGLNIFPSIFTMAIFPLMSRYARDNEENLLRSYILCVRLLVIVSLPLAMVITFLAEPLVSVVGGALYLHIPETITLFGREITYLGGSELALRVIIWSIPIGFVNSVTQYVLIAVNQQRYLTKAFIIGVVFNTVGNLLLIPSYGYLAAALVTILSEFSLLFPFYYSVKRNVGTVPWLSIILAPLLSIIIMGAATYGLITYGFNLWMAVALGCVVYGVALIMTGAFRHEEMAVIGRTLPLGPARRFFFKD